jgi:hypothetical protein
MNRSSSDAVESTLQVGLNFPLWVLISAMLVFAGFAAWIYWLERGRAPRWVRFLLASVRCALFLLVLWMLMGWSWQRARVENPELVIAVDVSQSMLTPDANPAAVQSAGMSRLEQVERLLSLSQEQIDDLQDKYQLKVYLVSNEATLAELDWEGLGKIGQKAFQNAELQTDESRLGDALIRIVERQSGRGTAAVVFFSDGITTSGRSLEEAARRARVSSIPVYTLSMGSQLVQPDLRIGELLVDDQLFLGDRANIEATVIGNDIPDSFVRVQLVDSVSGKVLDQQNVPLSENESQASVMLSYLPEQQGEKSLEVLVENYPGETNTANNRSPLTLNVQDRDISILLTFAQPSYEFRYLKHFLERSTQAHERRSATFALTSVLQDSDLDYVLQDSAAQRFLPSDSQQISRFDVFILGPLDPSLIPRSTQESLVRAVTNGGSGCIFMINNARVLKRLLDSPLGVLVPIESIAEATEIDRNFRWNLTRLGEAALPLQWNGQSDGRGSIQERLPPLSSVLPVKAVKTGAQVLANALSLDSGREYPLLMTQFAGKGRVAMLATDETYRWTSFYGSDDVHQRFWGQLLRWLPRGKLAESSPSELTAEPKQAKLGTPIRLQLGLSGDLSEPEDAAVRLTGPDGFDRTVTLERIIGSRSSYGAMLEELPPGEFRAILVDPPLANPPATDFSVVAPQSEQANLRSEIEAMELLAEGSQGKSYRGDQADGWLDALPRGRPIRLGTLPAQPIWNRHWVALLFVLLISAEWTLRRYARML